MPLFPQTEKLLHSVREATFGYFHDSVAFKFLTLCQGDEKVCIACSGGSDSVFLTLIFCSYFDDLARNASILHLNHGLRGEDSRQDAEFVKAFAKSLNLNFISGTLKKFDTIPSEGILRDVRYTFFEKQMSVLGSKILLLGQQKNDLAETLIMRLARASGIEGLSAPHEIRKFSNGTTRLRPLLNIKKETIESVLTNLAVPWRMDLSNLECDYFRNKVRNIVFKNMQNFTKQYDIIENFSESHKQIAEANEVIELIASSCLGKVNFGKKLLCSAFSSLPKAIVRRILHKWALHNELEIKKSEFDKLLASILACEHLIINSIGGQRIIFANQILQCSSGKKIEASLNFNYGNWVEGTLFFSNGKKLHRTIHCVDTDLIKSMKNSDISSKAYISGDGSLSIQVRNFDPIIEYVRFGHKNRRKLGNITNKSVEDYPCLPVLFVDDNACWMPGLPISNLFRVKENTKYALLLTYS